MDVPPLSSRAAGAMAGAEGISGIGLSLPPEQAAPEDAGAPLAADAAAAAASAAEALGIAVITQGGSSGAVGGGSSELTSTMALAKEEPVGLDREKRMREEEVSERGRDGWAGMGEMRVGVGRISPTQS